MSDPFKNRYGDIYWFESISDDTYIVRGDLKHWRYGGKEGQESLNESDLGFVDPSGGPFIAVGYKINNKSVSQISVIGNDIYLKVA